MCIMLTKPANVELNYDAIEECHWRNNDGCGYTAALPNGMLVTFRSSEIRFQEFWRKLKEHNKHPMLIHFRAATSGGVTHENTHPFLLGKGDYAMAHNGVINCTRQEGESDTRAFIRLAIDPYIGAYPNIIERPKWQEYAQNAIGKHNNKLAFIRKDGQFFYINKNLGVEEYGCWWSNRNFKPAPAQTRQNFMGFNARDISDSEYDLADAIYQERRDRLRQRSMSQHDDSQADEFFGKLYDERCEAAIDFLDADANIIQVEEATCKICDEVCTTPYLLDADTFEAMCMNCKNTYAKNIEPNQPQDEDHDDAEAGSTNSTATATAATSNSTATSGPGVAVQQNSCCRAESCGCKSQHPVVD